MHQLQNKAAVFHNSDNNVCNKNTRYFALSTVNVYRWLCQSVCHLSCLWERLQSVISRLFFCHLWSLSSRLLVHISIFRQAIFRFFKSESTSVLLMSAAAKPQHNIHGFVHHNAGRPQCKVWPANIHHASGGQERGGGGIFQHFKHLWNPAWKRKEP